MPWMTENDHTSNPNRNRLKDVLYVNRAKNLILEEKLSEFKKVVKECSDKGIDRDTEFRLALDCLELLSLEVDYQEAASIFAADVDLEIKYGRISPVQGCIARDVVKQYARDDFNIYEFLPDESYLKPCEYKNKSKSKIKK